MHHVHPFASGSMLAMALLAPSLPGQGPVTLLADVETALALLTNGSGDASQPLPIPASPAFAGLRLAAQWAVLQGGPFLGFASLSNGVDLVLQAQ